MELNQLKAVIVRVGGTSDVQVAGILTVEVDDVVVDVGAVVML